MSHTNPFVADGNGASRPSQAASHAIRETQAAIHNALDALAESMQSLGDDAAHTSRAVDASLHDSLDAVRASSRALFAQARNGSAQVQRSIRREPVKAVLIAAASGAAVAALLALLMRSRERG